MSTVIAEQFTGFLLVVVGTDNVSPFTGLVGNNSPTLARFTFEGSACRYRLDGVTAHSASGHLVTAGEILLLRGPDSIKNFNVICTNTTGRIQASFGRL